MGLYEDKIADLLKQRKAEAEARKARDEQEIERVVELLAGDESLVMVRFEEASADLPGHVVGRRPGTAEITRYKHVIFRDSSQRGAVEAKANAHAALASQCLVWPPRDRYNALCEKYVLVPEKFAQALVAAAEAGAEEEQKK